MALARILAMMAGQRSAVYRGSNATANSGSSSMTLDFAGIGAQAGDLGIVNAFVPGSENTTAISGWTKLTDTWPSPFVYVSQYHYKILSSADIASGVTITGLHSTPSQQELLWAAYRGPTSLAIRGSVGSGNVSSTSLTIPGASPAGNSMGWISLENSQITTDTSPAVNNGFTVRRVGNNATGFALISLADAVSAYAYINGSNVVWSNLTNSNPRQAALLELLG